MVTLILRCDELLVNLYQSTSVDELIKAWMALLVGIVLAVEKLPFDSYTSLHPAEVVVKRTDAE